MLRITIALSIACCFLWRPFQLQRSAMMYGGDDPSYFAFATSIVFGTYPDFSQEYMDEEKVPPRSRVGPGLLMVPFVAAFSILDRIEKHPVVEKRTRETILKSWSAFGAFLSVIFYFWLACWVTYLYLRKFFDDKTASWAVIAFYFIQGMPLYALRRPIFSHIPELLIQACFVYAWQNAKAPPASRWLLTGALSTLAPLIRRNFIPYAFFWPLLMACRPRMNKKLLVYAVLTILGSYVIGKLILDLPTLLNSNYNQQFNPSFESSSWLLEDHTLYFYLKRAWTIVFGLDWGLLFTAPYLLVSFAGLLCVRFPDRREWQLAALPLLINLYIVDIWSGQGGWYGYRYLLFMACPVLIVPFIHLARKARLESPLLFKIGCAWGLIPLFSMLVFEHRPSVGLSVITTEFNYTNWGNLTYQIEVWKLVFLHPFEAIYSVFKAGPAFFVFAVTSLLKLDSLLPAKFKEIYPEWSWKLLVEAALVYMLPWILYFGTRKSKFLFLGQIKSHR